MGGGEISSSLSTMQERGGKIHSEKSRGAHGRKKEKKSSQGTSRKIKNTSDHLTADDATTKGNNNRGNRGLMAWTREPRGV